MSGDRAAVENGVATSISANGQHRQPRLSQDHHMREPIAIVGFSMKLPQGVESEDTFWRFLVEKRCTSTEFPPQRLNASARYHPDGSRRDTIPFRGGHFIEGDIAAFDAPFFRISATEAAALDPQQRGMLETTYRALENAGMPLEKVAGSKTSVHTGCFLDDYQQIAFKDSEQCASSFGLSMGRCMLANRISWFFNFTGTSCQVDTACSSTLVALHLACNELINGDANTSVVAGSNLIFSLDPNLVLSNMNMLSPDSRCFSFDSRANGYARGEGFGTLILKRLSDAIRDRDTIRAVVRSTGSNSDGYTPGITQPSSDLQKKLIEETYRKAGLDLMPTRYLEAHATGTPTGDPIEMTAIGSVFRSIRTTDDPLIVGAVKSNFGHSEGLSGIVSVIKAILALERAIIPPNTNFEELNPKIDAEMLRVKFPLEAEPWPVEGLRRASVNSFGYGGTNAHIVLDDAFHYLQHRGLDGSHITVSSPPSMDTARSLNRVQVNACSHLVGEDLPKPILLTLSTYDRDGIHRLVSRYEEFFSRQRIDNQVPESCFSELAHTLNVRRSSLPWKSHAIISSVGDLKALSSKISQPWESKKDVALCFVFTGQGAQWAGMGRELSNFHAFTQSLEKTEKYLKEFGCKWSLLEEMAQPKHASNINKPDFSQPITTAIQIGLTDLLRGFGVLPTAVIGHSSGEIAAAYATGAISARAAMRIAYYRGYFAAALAISKNRPGSMLAVGLAESQAQRYIDDVKRHFSSCDLVVACINSPKNVTISGDAAQIDHLKNTLEKDEVFTRHLMVDVAYHSSHMQNIAKEYGQSLGYLDEGIARFPRATMISTVTGQSVTGKQLRLPSYWIRNMVSPVKFATTVAQLCTQSAKTMRKKLDCSHRSHLRINVLLEVGPHSALHGPIRDILSDIPARTSIKYVPTLVRYQNSVHSLLSCTGSLHCMGCPIDLEKVNFSPGATQRPKLLSNLPEYPFDHSRKYWHESRISKNFRMDDRSKLDLLGKPVADWNHLEPQWRTFIRVSEMPWVEHHVINGSLLYPAAGMLAMAIEAANQLTSDSRATIGFSLKHITFERALTIPQDSEGIETRFHLRRLIDSSTYGSNWHEFRLYSYQNDQFREHCYGLLCPELEAEKTELHPTAAEEQLKEACQVEAGVIQACTKSFNKDNLYNTLNLSGYGFGPTFQTLRNGRFCDSKAHANIKIFEWPAEEYPQPHIVHPTTLDGVLHLGLAALSDGGKEVIPTGVPSYIESLWIAKSGLSDSQSSSISASTWISSKDNRGVEFDASVLDVSKTQVLVRLDGLKLTVVTDSTPTSLMQETEKRICHKVEYWPDIDFMSNERLADYCGEARLKSHDPIQFYSDLLYVSLIFLHRVIESNASGWSDRLQPHLYKYIEWANVQLQRYRDGNLPHARPEWKILASDPARFEELCDAIEATNAVGRAFVQTGRNLPRILQCEMDPLDFLFRSDILKDLYHELSTGRTCFSEFERYLNTFTQKRPHTRILEIGAGTGGTTAKVLHALSNTDSGSRYACYHYTDLSPSFFEKAQEMFSHYPRMSFKQLDIESDPKNQGFESNSYDLIVAANVLHATKDIELTMHNVRKLLRPGGKLMMYELTRPEILRTGFVAGLMSGWWLAKEDFRKWGPALNLEQWERCLRDTGFSGLDLQLPDFVSDKCQESSILVTTAVGTDLYQQGDFRLAIIANTNSESQIQDAANLKKGLQQQDIPDCGIKNLDEAARLVELEKTTLVFIEELERPLLADLSEEKFSKLQEVITACHGAVWISAGGGRSTKNPAYATIDGLFRALRNEYPQKQFAAMALDKQGSFTKAQLKAIRSVICNLERDEDSSNRETEYTEIQGMMMIPRVQRSENLTEILHQRSLPRQVAVQSVKESPPLKLIIDSPGVIDNLRFSEKSFSGPLALDEIEIRVHAVGVNKDDSIRAFGKLSGTTIGKECAGVVTRVSQKCDFVPGDRVVMYASEGTQTAGRWKLEQVCKVPDTLSLADAASLPMQFGAAWEILHEVARIRQGDSVLVTSAAEAHGQAFVQVAKHVGAQVFATVESDDEKQLLLGEYNLAEAHIFFNSHAMFGRAINGLTAGRGIDIVINDLEGDGLITSWECIANHGRFVDVSLRDGPSNVLPPLSSKRKNVSFVTFDFSSWLEDQSPRAVENLDVIMGLVAQGSLRVVQPLHSHDISNVGNVLRSIHEGKTHAKHVLEIGPESMVPVGDCIVKWHDIGSHLQTLLDTKSKYSLDSNATYVIAGGLGGIGRSVARWMISRGARNLLLLSRSGAKSRASQAFVTELENEGACVRAPACDIANYIALETILKQCAAEMPPIRGCIQAAMVLADSLYETMSHSTWKTATSPKIAGSRNLHRLLPQDPSSLDFFILLSSIDGIIGLPGQANYAAGNTYLDALARYRVANGQKAVSLDLGVMLDDGFLAENEKVRTQVLGYGALEPVSRELMHAMLEYYCDPSLPVLAPQQSQAIIGLSTGKPTAVPGGTGTGTGMDGSSLLRHPLFRHVQQQQQHSDSISSSTPPSTSSTGAEQLSTASLRALFLASPTLPSAAHLVSTALVRKLARSLPALQNLNNPNPDDHPSSVDVDVDVDIHAPLSTFGVDSLVAVEIRGWLKRELAADVAVFEILGGASLMSLGMTVAGGRSALVKGGRWDDDGDGDGGNEGEGKERERGGRGGENRLNE